MTYETIVVGREDRCHPADAELTAIWVIVAPSVSR